MAEVYGGNCVKYMSWGVGESQAWLKVDTWHHTDDLEAVRIQGAVSSVGGRTIAQYGVVVQCGNDGTNEWQESRAVFNYNDWVGWVDITYYVPRYNYGRNITCWTKYWGETVNGYGAGGWNGAVYLDVWIPAKPYYKHGNPTISVSKNSVPYGESITVSWAKASYQGNANFHKFILTDGMGKHLSDGVGTSVKSTPSAILNEYGKDAYYNGTSAPNKKKGWVYYAVCEIHEWYGSYPESDWVWIGVEVKSGVVSFYDASGKKLTGLITVYDDAGNAHYTLVNTYDANGKKHDTQ